MDKLIKFLKKTLESEERILILGHPHADPDAIGSLIALKEILEKLGLDVDAGVPKGVDRLSKGVLSEFNAEVTVNPSVNATVAIIVDTSTLDQLEDYEEEIRGKDMELIVIDHHMPNSKTREVADIYHIDENSSSTSELILKLARKLKINLSSRTASILLTGIITDTGHFRLANKSTFHAVSELMGMGADYSKALNSIQVPEDPSKRIAMLKAIKRAELYKSHGRWIIFTEISAFESDAASLFIKIGADVALAGGGSKSSVRISARSRKDVVSETNLHLGEIMSRIADDLNGTGGGHAGAAAITVERELDYIKDILLSELKKMLKPK